MNLPQDIKNKLRALIVIILVVIIFDIINVFFIPLTLAGELEVEIYKGQSLRAISKTLEDAKIIKSRHWFEILAQLKGYHRNLKAGRYLFNGKLSLAGVLDKIARGDSLPDDYEVVIPEGYTLFDIDKRLSEMGAVEKGNFIRQALYFDNSDARFGFLPSAQKINLEGYLFPDTYRIKYGSKAEDIIFKMLVNFEGRVWDKYKSRKNFEELINMASIIQKEVFDPEEMKLVAGVLWKRLKIRMPLQADATLYYFKCYKQSATVIPQRSAKGGTAEPSTRNDCSVLTDEDKALKSDYNTYFYKGLPLGPISNSGIDAIAAAVNPINSPYLYYLSARKDGRTIFAKTLQEHNRNIYKYR